MKLSIPIYNDVWMDNALENFYSLLNDYDLDNKLDINLRKDKLCINFENNDFKEVLEKIINNHKYYSCIKEQKENEIVEYKKDFIIIQHNRNGQHITLKPNLFKNTSKEISKLVDSMSEGSKTCVLCGSLFDKKYSSLNQSAYPLATKIKSLSGVRTYKNGQYYSFKDYNDSSCPICYLIGILGWFTEKVIYRNVQNDNNFLLFLPKLNNLHDLHEFKMDYSVLLNNTRRWSNIRVSPTNDLVENTFGKYSTLLCFYGKFLLVYGDIPDMEWNIMTIPKGKVKNIKISNFTFNEKILKIIKVFINEYYEEIYSLFDSIYVISDAKIDYELTHDLKENLANSFLKDNFRLFSKNFVIKKGKKFLFSKKKIDFFKYFNLFIEIWRIKPMGINEDDLKTIRSVANIISKVSIKNLSLFYKLDKVKNIGEFWSCLREISKKLISLELDKKLIKPSSLDDLIVLLKSNENNWKEIRDLLIIYSSMYYSINNGDYNEN